MIYIYINIIYNYLYSCAVFYVYKIYIIIIINYYPLLLYNYSYYNRVSENIDE